MNGKRLSVWVCQDCGSEQLAWSGRCGTCGGWNTLKELRLPAAGGAASAGPVRAREPLVTVRLRDATLGSAACRLETGLGEVDRVTGGGFFPGSLLLLAGEPGVGKSTLLLMIAHQLSRTHPVVYVSGEESAAQVASRGHRLGFSESRLELVSATDLEAVLELLAKKPAKFVIIDSIQTLADPRLPSVAGSIVQVRGSALTLQQWAKTSGTTLLLVGHLTKDGVAAGPRTLEHLVDVVLYLETTGAEGLRLLRASKNRFGPTDDVGIFEMTSEGLQEVTNPSARFLGGHDSRTSGTVATVLLEGRRPLVVEIQALTRKSSQAYPRRTGLGIESARLELILAVLESRAGVRFDTLDAFVSVGGGLRVREPAADLAIALALASSATAVPLPTGLVAFGELGLGGEIRAVGAAERRTEEARRLGFDTTVKAKSLSAALAELGLGRRGPTKER